jgi:hypothetical protein
MYMDRGLGVSQLKRYTGDNVLTYHMARHGEQHPVSIVLGHEIASDYNIHDV